MLYLWLSILGGIIFRIILIFVVASDAKSRGHSWLLWGTLTFFFGIFAVIIYLVTRNDNRIQASVDQTEEKKEPGKIRDIDTGRWYAVDEENWERLPSQFGIEYQEISKNEDGMILIAKRENKVGKFLISDTGVMADSVTQEKNSERWVKRTSKLLDIHFN